MNTIEETAALKRMAGYCARGERSRFDVYEKLKKMEFDSPTIARILNTLQTEGFIDDERFCRSFVNDKLRFNKWGRLKIAQALAFRKISSEIVYRCLDEIDEDEYMDILRKIIAAKKRSVKGKDKWDVEAKLIRFAASRGFEMHHIKQCL